MHRDLLHGGLFQHPDWRINGADLNNPPAGGRLMPLHLIRHGEASDGDIGKNAMLAGKSPPLSRLAPSSSNGIAKGKSSILRP